MPIDKEEFESGHVLTDIEKKVISFLESNPDKAFTSNEIIDGINMQTDFTDFWKAVSSGINLLGFPYVLYRLVNEGRIRTNFINGKYYYMVKKHML
ncbi:MAG TPA: hypothetical protein VK536_05020 [Candidatus Limnocylindrales bacterium]|nr:hypothetical protein [Candidatus Limnocylindrales bacterium]